MMILITTLILILIIALGDHTSRFSGICPGFMRCVPVSRRLVQKSKIVPVFICQEGNEIVNLNLGSVISLQMIIKVLGQNGSGQNGTDKMARTKWYGSNITNKVIIQSSSHLQYDCFINSASTLTPSVFFYGLVIYL